MMEIGRFVRETTFTTFTGSLNLFLGLAASIILARLLGPEGKGIYAMAVLLPSLILTLTRMGIGPATGYYIGRGQYPKKEILGCNIILAFVVGSVGLMGGLIVVLFFGQDLFPNISYGYLPIALTLFPLNLFFYYLHQIFLGIQKIKEYNVLDILYPFFFLALLTVCLWGLGTGVRGALFAGIFAWILADTILMLRAKKATGGISFKPNLSYLKDASIYGVKAHLGNIFGFLNYRIDMFLVNWFLNPSAVGIYSISVALAERLWLVSRSAGTVLFSRIVGETDELKRKDFTPLVVRTVFWFTALAALLFFFLARYIITLLFSEAFLRAVRPSQILLSGIVVLSVRHLLANDLAGRGRPVLNTYATGIAVCVNVMLNVLWIPRYGIDGAAWASVVSYGIAFIIVLAVYCRVSENSPVKVLLPQRTDWPIYRSAGGAFCEWAKEKLHAVSFLF